MDYQNKLDKLLLDRKNLIQSCTKDGVFDNRAILDGSFAIKLNKINIDIGQLEDLIYG